ncbi:MAG: mandelate racemase/muconate lactonizing enzyme family protein [Saprospiraceae bacterium]|nr:mandelate racemase/muconate lactonizing enzyme family protein [Saprospiraceae bacterium]MBP7643323.1 mandelate racemase/muconate lactonizing enzyme family protein [Saprospiraceae bacterium]
MNPSQKFLEKLGLKDPVEEEKIPLESNGGSDRRDFLKQSLGGITLGSLFLSRPEEILEHSTSKVNKFSAPSDLKITDMKYAVVMNGNGRCPVIKIDTNQGIVGLGEVRDGADWRYALFLKSRIKGMNPTSVDLLFRRIKQFGFHARQGGGVCAVEMALWDLAGKAYNVPAYQLLGGKFRDKIRLYADTPQEKDSTVFAEKMRVRMKDKGFTFLKMDFGIELVKDIPGAIVNGNFWDVGRQWSNEPMSYGAMAHPLTQVQITEKGLEAICLYIEKVRNVVGYEIPLASDHYGHFDLNNAIRLGQAVEKFRLAWLEDMIPWQFTSQLKEIKTAINTPLCTGEDIYLKEEFIKLCDTQSVDIVHPDLATSGGLLETKKIGDYAEEKGIAMAMHFAGLPISFMANVHCAAATLNVVGLENHSIDVPYWTKLVKTVDGKPLYENGFAAVPDSPGLGIELNEEEMKQHLAPDNKTFFEPTPEWDNIRSWDRLWS